MYTQTLIFMTNAIVPVGMQFVCYNYYLRKFLLHLQKKKGDKCVLTQGEANLLII